MPACAERKIIWKPRAKLFGLALVLAGLTLAQPVSAASVDTALERVAARTLPLDLQRLGSARTGTLVHNEIRLYGLPVVGASETVHIPPSGPPEVLQQVLPASMPQLLPQQVRLSPAEAAQIAHTYAVEARGREVPLPSEEPEPVYILILGRPVLAYQVEMPLTMGGAEPTRKTIWVSAASGRVLDEWEHVRASRARIFPTNPAHTPVPEEVELTGVMAEGPGEFLTGPRVISLNCQLDEPENPEDILPWWDEGDCYPLQKAVSDDNGDFFVPLPDVRYPQDSIDGNDLYAELSMYYHAERFLDHMATFGVEEFKCEQSTMLANMRFQNLAVSYPDLEYGPLNNAYYTNQCDIEKGPTMIFGQGSEVDFGLDGDVVYHELGHGMVSLLTPAGLGSRRMRPDGLLADAGGINEAMADYFSVMLTDSPALGDYVARYWDSYGKSEIRHAENTKRCPDDTIGQVHNDGEPFMAAMWAARKRIGAEKYDPIAFELLARLPRDADLETASLTVLAIAQENLAAGLWTEADLEQLHRAFDARNLFDCPRVLTDPELVVDGRTMYLRQKTSTVTPFNPGPMQMRHEVPLGADNLIVEYKLAPRGSSTGNPNTNPVGSLVLLKYEDEPIKFDYALTAYDEDGDPSLPTDIDEIIHVTGDWDEQHSPTATVDGFFKLVVRGLAPGEVVHISLVNTHKTEAVASLVRAYSVDSNLLDQGSMPGPGEEVESEGFADSEGSFDRGEATASCVCTTNSQPQPWSAWALSLLVLAGLRRRRVGE